MEDSLNFLQIEGIVVVLLILVSVVAMFAQRIRLPYTVMLVLVGLALSFLPIKDLEILPGLILMLFLPPLVFEAALHIDLATLRSLLSQVLLLAIPGVLIVTFIIGGVLAQFADLDLKVALLFGALIAATDPVAVVSLFKALGAPKRLATLVESESLFNDGTTIVLFTIIVLTQFPLQGRHSPFTEMLLHIAGLNQYLSWVLAFLGVALGGVFIGGIVGIIGDRIFASIDDHLIETTLSTVIAYGTYLVAESVGLSGVLAVVTAGIVVGNHSSGSMSPTTRTVLMSFWEYVAFLANSAVFVLISMRVHIDEMIARVDLILAALFAVIMARAVSVYGLAAIHRLFGSKLRTDYLHILVWGGLRGAVSLALVLSLIPDTPDKTFGLAPDDYKMLLNMTYGVVLFTLLVQATTISGLLKRLGLVGRPQAEIDYEQIQGRLLAVRAAHRRLSDLYSGGALDPHAWEVVSRELNDDIDRLSQELTDFARANPVVVAKIIHSTQREALRTQRAAIMNLQREGILSEEVSERLFREIDTEMETSVQPTWTGIESPSTANRTTS